MSILTHEATFKQSEVSILTRDNLQAITVSILTHKAAFEQPQLSILTHVATFKQSQ